MEYQTILDRLSNVLLKENMPTLDQVKTWSNVMCNEVLHWLDNMDDGERPYFLRYYMRGHDHG
jgi:hypothetical protein